eukprot:523743-Prorocentrum_minimum.AAC.2
MQVGADIVKIANTAQDISDVRRIMNLIETQSVHGPVIGLAMGERGQMTRILAPKFGTFLTPPTPPFQTVMAGFQPRAAHGCPDRVVPC